MKYDYKTWDQQFGKAVMGLSFALYDLLRPRSVIDFGCGSGIFLIPFLFKGVEILGLDNDSNAGYLIPDHFEQIDITESFHTDKFDLAICVETVEHISEEYENQVIRNIANASDKILFSAAKPGQAGTDHINLKPLDHWAERLLEHGLHLSPETSVLIKLMDDPEFDNCPWLRENLVVLSR